MKQCYVYVLSLIGLLSGTSHAADKTAIALAGLAGFAGSCAKDYLQGNKSGALEKRIQYLEKVVCGDPSDQNAPCLIQDVQRVQTFKDLMSQLRTLFNDNGTFNQGSALYTMQKDLAHMQKMSSITEKKTEEALDKIRQGLSAVQSNFITGEYVVQEVQKALDIMQQRVDSVKQIMENDYVSSEQFGQIFLETQNRLRENKEKMTGAGMSLDDPEAQFQLNRMQEQIKVTQAHFLEGFKKLDKELDDYIKAQITLHDLLSTTQRQLVTEQRQLATDVFDLSKKRGEDAGSIAELATRNQELESRVEEQAKIIALLLTRLDAVEQHKKRRRSNSKGKEVAQHTVDKISLPFVGTSVSIEHENERSTALKAIVSCEIPQ